MADLENLSLTLSLAGDLLFLILSLAASLLSQQQAAARIAVSDKNAAPAAKGKSRSCWGVSAFVMSLITLLLITVVIVSRIIQTGHGPFSSMYEFALAFAWGVVIAGLGFYWRYQAGSILDMSFFIALLLLIFARARYAPPDPLVPALQQSTLLSIHVASAVVAYGTLTIGFGAAVLYLVKNRYHSYWLPDLDVLDAISYRAVVIGFPFLTLVIVLGALWADIAWGRYWGWDPKETASLVTWLIYAAYIHARVMRGWQGIRSSILLLIGFAAILLTFFGNYIFTGLHAYG